MKILQLTIVAIVAASVAFSPSLSHIATSIIALALLIVFHELGHFLAARACGIGVSTFSIGFGPEILGYTSRSGTRWKLSTIPLGGYIVPLQTDNPSPETATGRNMEYSQASLLRRFITIAAGPTFSIILAYPLIFGAVSTSHVQIATNIIETVAPGSPAEKAGLLPGDTITSINNHPISTKNAGEIHQIIITRDHQPTPMGVLRNGTALTLNPIPLPNKRLDGQPGIDIDLKTIDAPPLTFWETCKVSFASTNELIARTFRGLIHLFGHVQDLATNVSGPIGMTTVTSEAVTTSTSSTLMILALITINLGITNLLPIPLADGGRMLFILIEAIIRRPISKEAEERSIRYSIAFLLLLMFVGAFNDISHIIHHKPGS